MSSSDGYADQRNSAAFNQSEIGQVKYPLVSCVSTRNIAARVKGRSRLRITMAVVMYIVIIVIKIIFKIQEIRAVYDMDDD